MPYVTNMFHLSSLLSCVLSSLFPEVWLHLYRFVISVVVRTVVMEADQYSIAVVAVIMELLLLLIQL